MNVDLIQTALLKYGKYDATHLKTVEIVKLIRTLHDKGLICALKDDTIILISIDSTKIG